MIITLTEAIKLKQNRNNELYSKTIKARKMLIKLEEIKDSNN